MPYLVAALALLACGVMSKLWWDEKHAEKPILPPSFVEQRIQRATLVPLTENISKVYAVCPEDNGLWGIGGVPKYLMSWTARVHYSIDLKQVKIKERLGEKGKTWMVYAPPITLFNNDVGLIGAKDHYKFHNEALIAKSGKALREHYDAEKLRAESIARYIADWRIHKDASLTQAVIDQLKLIFYVQIAQISGQKADFQDVEVKIAAPVAQIKPPARPSLCAEQPFETNLALSEIK